MAVGAAVALEEVTGCLCFGAILMVKIFGKI